MPTDVLKQSAWKSIGLSDESIMPTTAIGNSLAPKLKQIYDSEIEAKFKGSCLKQDKETFTQRNVANLFTDYQLKKLN